MALFPHEIASREFFSAADGYDKEEVRAYLHVVAREHAALIDALERAKGDGAVSDVSIEISAVLANASAAADEIRKQAHEEALVIRQRAEEEARSLRRATEEASDRLREEAEQYAFEVRNAADNVAREQQVNTADRIGRLLTGEAKIRERLFNLETSLQALRGQLQEAAEEVYPELEQKLPPLPSTARGDDGREPSTTIDLDEGVRATRPNP